MNGIHYVKFVYFSWKSERDMGRSTVDWQSNSQLQRLLFLNAPVSVSVYNLMSLFMERNESEIKGPLKNGGF